MKLRDANDLINFTVADVDINEIAHCLSQICRFAGGTPTLYSVAEHSIIVSQMALNDSELKAHGVNMEYSLRGLLHDAHEPYIGDIITPVKKLTSMPEVDDIVRRIDYAISEYVGINFTVGCQIIKRFDTELFNAEKYKFYGIGETNKLADRIKCLSSKEAEIRFLGTFRGISRRLQLAESGKGE